MLDVATHHLNFGPGIGALHALAGREHSVVIAAWM